MEAFRVAASPPGLAPGILVGHIVGPGHGMPVANNAIHPGWRQASSFSITVMTLAVNATKADKANAQNVLTNTVDEGLRKASPRGGA